MTISENDIKRIAHVCHEANRAIQLVNPEDHHISPPFLDAPPFLGAPEWMIDSSIMGVKEALSGKSPEEIHQAWFDFKIKNGWVFGDVRDDVKKTHPCLVPYEELSMAQRIKDHVFQAIVLSMADIFENYEQEIRQAIMLDLRNESNRNWSPTFRRGLEHAANIVGIDQNATDQNRLSNLMKQQEKESSTALEN